MFCFTQAKQSMTVAIFQTATSARFFSPLFDFPSASNWIISEQSGCGQVGGKDWPRFLDAYVVYKL